MEACMANLTTPRTANPTALRNDLDAELPRLRAQARHLCRSDSDALDLVQDTLVRALVYERSFEPGTNLRAWLSQILRSVFVSRYRRSKRERRALERLTHDPVSWPHHEPALTLAPLGARTRIALAELPDSFRRVVELVDLGGLEYIDAARELAVPVGTVMSRLYRGRRILAARLEDREQRPEVPRRAA
jgi:RNA polymerase sigma-70 factor (ECF subfamily)